MHNSSRTRSLAITGMLAALASVLLFFEFHVPLMPPFIKMDFSDLPALIAAFSLGPVSGIAVCLVKNLINLLFSSTGGVGGLVNFLLSVCLILPAGWIYQKKQTRRSALLGTLLGAVVMALASLPLNYYIIYPIYTAFMPMETILSAYQTINPAVQNLWDALLWFNLPFTFIKGVLVALVAFLIYRPLRPLFSGEKLIKKM